MKRKEKRSRNIDNIKIENKTINYLKIIKHLSKFYEDENKNILSTESKINLKLLNEGNTISYKAKEYQTNFKQYKTLQSMNKGRIGSKKKNNYTEYLQRSGGSTKKKKIIIQEYLLPKNKEKKMKQILFGNNQKEKSFNINSNFIEMNNYNNNINNDYHLRNKNIIKKNIKNIIKSKYKKYRSKYIALSNDISNAKDYQELKNKVDYYSKSINEDESNKELSDIKNYKKGISSSKNSKTKKYIADNKIVLRKKMGYLGENKTYIHKKSISNSRNKITNIFNYLIKTYESLNLSKTFNKIDIRSNSNDKKKKIISKKNSLNKKNKVKSVHCINKNNSISLIIKKYEKGKFRKNNSSYDESSIYPNDLSREKKNNQKNIFKISPKKNNNNTISYNNINKRSNNYTKKNSNISSNKIINNNIFNTVYNIYKINSMIAKDDCIPKYKEKIYKIHPQKSLNNNKRGRKLKKSEKMKLIDIENSIEQNNINQNKEIIINKSRIAAKSISTIELLYLLESKNNSILYKINNYKICNKECQDWILCYFENNIYDKIINLFNNSRNKLNITNKIKIEILCYFLCYDSCFSKNFSQAGILLKTIFHLLHNNFLLLILYKINHNTSNNENNYYNHYLCNNLNIIINRNLKINLSIQEIQNENCIMEIIEENYKHINNYYKMLVDNLYNDRLNFQSLSLSNNNLNEIKDNKIYKFPQCLSLNSDSINNNKKMIISSLFFIDAYNLLNNYNIIDLKIFFDIFLHREKYFHTSKINYLNNNEKLSTYQKNRKNYNKINYSSKYLLSPIKSCYKYTLLININVLMYFKEINSNHIGRYNSFNKNINENKNKKVILRPGLIDFLEDVKDIYELIFFSNNSLENIHILLKYIENCDKYFRHILSNSQINFNKDGTIKDLNLLGRNIKRIIIIDTEQNIFKLNTENENVIYVKPFYGEISNDRNILSNLNDILKKIRNEIEDNDNIKVSLRKHKLDIFTKISTQLL